ncbi:hypothetical protein [Massilia niabensis]|uniref:Uncharacterized protein n=1 Tax=Massilia niabensis TaxID=544910 RepID=A0ABW0L6E2_9BURK
MPTLTGGAGSEPDAGSQGGEIFFAVSVSCASRAAVTLSIARIEGVMACEGTRVLGATVPSWGSGLVLARAGKALEARCELSGTLQAAANTAVSGLVGDAGSCTAHPGSPAHTAATTSGMFMVSSIDMPF